jgi:hypothetical protein
MRSSGVHDDSAHITESGQAYRIRAVDLLKFLDGNPGVLLSLLGAHHVS